VSLKGKVRRGKEYRLPQEGILNSANEKRKPGGVALKAGVGAEQKEDVTILSSHTPIENKQDGDGKIRKKNDQNPVE